MNEEEIEKLKDLKAVYSGAIQSGEIGIANIIKGGIDLIEKLQSENEVGKKQYESLVNDYEELNQKNIELQKENEELKFEERSRIIGKYGDVEIHDAINRTLSNDYISVQKIKNKIENLKKVKEKNIKKNFDTVYKDGYFTGGIDTLQELLEGRK